MCSNSTSSAAPTVIYYRSPIILRTYALCTVYAQVHQTCPARGAHCDANHASDLHSARCERIVHQRAGRWQAALARTAPSMRLSEQALRPRFESTLHLSSHDRAASAAIGDRRHGCGSIRLEIGRDGVLEADLEHAQVVPVENLEHCLEGGACAWVVCPGTLTQMGEGLVDVARYGRPIPFHSSIPCSLQSIEVRKRWLARQHVVENHRKGVYVHRPAIGLMPKDLGLP